jgi:S-adenosylmethionine:tRNA ribosyltransferase-isomerase
MHYPTVISQSRANVRLDCSEVSLTTTHMTQEPTTCWIPPVESSITDYELPPDRIAQYPLPVRDSSKLLYADARRKFIRHHIFYELPTLLPEGAFIVRNTTRVIPARIIATKPTGGHVEVLLVAPTEGLTIDRAMASATSTWECLVGGKRMRPGLKLTALHSGVGIHVTIDSITGMHVQATIECVPPTATLAEQLTHLGHMPLPPYIRRTITSEDAERYQTIYAQQRGSVAAPTAGLHFTDRVLAALDERGIDIVDVVLHVGPGTFQPLRAEVASAHTMHAERIVVERSQIEQLSKLFSQPDRCCVCVGTTSVRTVETLYWLGVKLIEGITEAPSVLLQEEPYGPPLRDTTIPPADALAALIDWLDQNGHGALEAATQLYIVPGYRYRMTSAVITNFHQPRSTLLLLVAAFIGAWWKNIYAEALSHGYRFLSYGDASLLIADPTASVPTT